MRYEDARSRVYSARESAERRAALLREFEGTKGDRRQLKADLDASLRELENAEFDLEAAEGEWAREEHTPAPAIELAAARTLALAHRRRQKPLHRIVLSFYHGVKR
jgi:hypothetical protein